MKRTGKIVLAAMLAASVLLTACGGSGNTGAEGTQAAAGSGTTSKSDGIIRIGMKADITSLDPHDHNDVQSSNATRHIYSNLIRVNSDHEVVGDLAESWEYTDDTTVAFKLKEGVQFSDGTPLTADDVKFSLERQKASSKVGHLVAMIDSVEVVDDLNFIIHMNQPSNALLTSLAHSGGAIMCRSYTEKLESEGKKLADAPMGTGPYTFVSWVPGSSVELKKNPNYFDKEREAQNEGLILKVIAEETSRTIALENGEIDILTDVGTNDAQKIRDNANLALDEYDSSQQEMMNLNTSKAPFDNVLVRQAMNHAINKEDCMIVAINGEGAGVDGYLAPGAIGYKDTAVHYEYDPELAKELLAEAGYADGFTFTTFVSNDERSRAATAIQANLQQIGVTMNIEQMEASTFYERTGNGEHDACISGWVANAEPDNTYRPLFTSVNAGPGGNRAFYKNPEVDALVDDAATNRDPEKVDEDYKEVTRIISGDAIWVPLYTQTGFVARQNNLQGIEISSFNMHVFTGAHYE
ncbi:MAG: ABC transporter substrate-binding protein [Eubacteriales bacterium]|nr:ABC transporter substrate-binding protein [Eubacteriales bacterium]